MRDDHAQGRPGTRRVERFVAATRGGVVALSTGVNQAQHGEDGRDDGGHLAGSPGSMDVDRSIEIYRLPTPEASFIRVSASPSRAMGPQSALAPGTNPSGGRPHFVGVGRRTLKITFDRSCLDG
jgi:hypothetical protein